MGINQDYYVLSEDSEYEINCYLALQPFCWSDINVFSVFSLLLEWSRVGINQDYYVLSEDSEYEINCYLVTDICVCCRQHSCSL